MVQVHMALALRREDKAEDAEEELTKEKAFEQQLEEMENAPRRPAPKVGTKSSEINHTHVGVPGALDLGEDGVEAEVTEQDLHDPAMMSILKNLGWNDVHEIDSKGNNKNRPLPATSAPVPEVTGIDWESFGKPGTQSEEGSTKHVSSIPPLAGSAALQPTDERTEIDNSHADKLSPTARVLPNSRINTQRNTGGDGKAAPKLVSPEKNTADGIDAQKAQVLAHKRKAVARKREGKLAEAREELRQAKLLENTVEGEPEPLQSNAGTTAASLARTPESTSLAQDSRTKQQQSQKPLSGHDHFKLQQESHAHKRNTLKPRSDGKIEESEAELELAKALESQLEELGNQGANKMEGTGDTGVKDMFDPQLMSALKSIGCEDVDLGGQPPKKPEPKLNADKGRNPPQGERAHLEEMIKAEKVHALNLKREGKQAEALGKRLEKKLASLT